MNVEFVNVLLLLAYFLFGTAGIVLLMGWALKHFGSAKRRTARPKGKPPAESRRQH